MIFYDTHNTLHSPCRIIMLNHLKLFWLPVIETFPAFSALLYFSPGATKLKSLQSATKLLK